LNDPNERERRKGSEKINTDCRERDRLRSGNKSSKAKKRSIETRKEKLVAEILDIVGHNGMGGGEVKANDTEDREQEKLFTPGGESHEKRKDRS